MRKVSSTRMLIIMCVFYVGANMAHPFTPTLFTNLNLPDYMFGVALACTMVMGFIMGPFWGKSSDASDAAIYQSDRDCLSGISVKLAYQCDYSLNLLLQGKMV